MNTKIVYGVISSLDDLYYEQMWASIWTVKHYTPSAHIIVLTDEQTERTMHSPERAKSLALIDEVQVVDFDIPYSNKEKSRYIKTKLRQLVKGDFLFIDNDTIVADDLSSIDSLDCPNIGAVLDYHCQSREICHYPIFKAMSSSPMLNIYGLKYNNSSNLYNSGVLLVKDTPKALEVFEKWHSNWQISRAKGECRDQLALLTTCQQLNNPLSEISGVYNCQIRSSIEFLQNAKIIHIFNSQKDSDIYRFFSPIVYQKIRFDKCITNDTKTSLINCKNAFGSPSFLIDKRWLYLCFTPALILLSDKMYSKRRRDKIAIYILNLVARGLSRIINH